MRLRAILLFPVALLLLTGCAGRGARLDQLDGEGLFAYGTSQLEARRWPQAIEAFERFVLVHPAHARVQEARYRIGEAYQGQREWVTAAAEFNRLANEHPAGPWADDARFQVCRSYYELAPPPQLYQEYTRSAIDHCQSLLTFYPESEYVARAQEIIVALVDRLAHKEYLNAEDYFRRRAFDSAIIYYEIVAGEFPTSQWAPRALLRLVQVYERLEYEPEARAARERLLREFPDSPEARQISGGAAARNGA
jgi:outer membrane protein assembly factor BamD